MKILFDLHTHTIASGHAYSTLKENIEEAKAKGLSAMGTSDHSKNMPGSAHPIFFANYDVIKDYIMGVRIYTGIEANIVDYSGKVDVSEGKLSKMDYVIASLHMPCIKPGTVEENTQALIGAMKNPYIKIIGHPDDGRYPLDYERLVMAAKEYKVALEVNNSSLKPGSGRQNAQENVEVMLKLCKEMGVYVIMNSDSHIYYDIGDMEYAEAAVQTCGVPPELVLNYDMERLGYVLNDVE